MERARISSNQLTNAIVIPESNCSANCKLRTMLQQQLCHGRESFRETVPRIGSDGRMIQRSKTVGIFLMDICAPLQQPCNQLDIIAARRDVQRSSPFAIARMKEGEVCR